MVASSDMSARRAAFLDCLAQKESGGKYNVAYGGSTFSSYAQHPGNTVAGGSGAAGRYQFIPQTWNGIAKQNGLSDFSPANQDKGAIALIKERGQLGNVDSGNVLAAAHNLRGTWTSLPGAAEAGWKSDLDFLKFYNSRLAYYKAGGRPDSGGSTGGGNGKTPQTEIVSAKIVIIDITDCISWQATAKTKAAVGAVDVKYLDPVTKIPTQTKVTKDPKTTIVKLPTAADKTLHPNIDAAKLAAATTLQASGSSEYSFTAKVSGNPNLTAEGRIRLTGFRKELCSQQELIVRSVTHTLDSSGYTTDVSATTPGFETNAFSAGMDGATGKPTGAGSSSVCKAAEAYKGTNTSVGPDNGGNACVWAVNQVLKKAGKSPPWGSSTYVPDARAALVKGGGTKLSAPEPGAIVIFVDNGSPPYPHIGIVECNGKTIISNSSSKRSFTWEGDEASYQSYYGKKPEYYRIGIS